MTIIVTGGAGFIGTNFVLNRLNKFDEKVIVVDKLTYAGNVKNFTNVKDNKNFHFIKCDITNNRMIKEILNTYHPRGLINFAAETHVDNSIKSPDKFIRSNIIGTYTLLKEIKTLYETSSSIDRKNFRFLNISTDEVFGSLNENDKNSTEDSSYKPNSPYSASKASADHLVRAFHQTYKIPVITTNCSNNYGPFQNKEKLIPTIIKNAMNWKSLPIYGDGKNIRDWIYVLDHCSALDTILEKGEIGQTYNIGSNLEMTNIEIVKIICKKLDEVLPHKNGSYSSLISFVEDRLGHDKKYALNCTKLIKELKWSPVVLFEDGILKTIEWYINNNK
jgi:dTDP-glucose 4,6-dehydratase